MLHTISQLINQLVNWTSNSAQESNLLSWHKSFVLVHHFYGGHSKSFFEVPLSEKLQVEEVGHILGYLPALSIETQVTGCHEDGAHELVVGWVSAIVSIFREKEDTQ